MAKRLRPVPPVEVYDLSNGAHRVVSWCDTAKLFLSDEEALAYAKRIREWAGAELIVYPGMHPDIVALMAGRGRRG